MRNLCKNALFSEGEPWVFVCKINKPIDEKSFEYLLSFVDEEKKNRIMRQRIKQNADNILAADILSRSVLKKYFGITVGTDGFSYTKYGKPYLKDRKDIYFNTSHSGEYVALAVFNRPVGVDIQKKRELCIKTVCRVCTDTELEVIEKSEDASAEFARIWTRKEAALKMSGFGILGQDLKKCAENKRIKSKKLGDYWLSICY